MIRRDESIGMRDQAMRLRYKTVEMPNSPGGNRPGGSTGCPSSAAAGRRAASQTSRIRPSQGTGDVGAGSSAAELSVSRDLNVANSPFWSDQSLVVVKVTFPEASKRARLSLRRLRGDMFPAGQVLSWRSQVLLRSSCFEGPRFVEQSASNTMHLCEAGRAGAPLPYPQRQAS